MITSPRSEALRSLATLIRSRKQRRKQGVAVIEGIHLLQSFIGRDVIVRVFVPEHAQENEEISALLGRLPEKKITVVKDGLLKSVSDLAAADDIVAVTRILPAEKPAVSGDCILLDRIRDPGNMGTILRSAAAADIRHVVVGMGCADVWSPKVLRAGMGAHVHLNIEEADLPVFCRHYPHPVYATVLSPDAASLFQTDLSKPCAWVFGNEGNGVDTVLLEHCRNVYIPMADGVESLNVAMAASICLFEQRRQRFFA